MTFRMNAKYVIKVFTTGQASNVTVTKNTKMNEDNLSLVQC